MGTEGNTAGFNSWHLMVDNVIILLQKKSIIRDSYTIEANSYAISCDFNDENAAGFLLLDGGKNREPKKNTRWVLGR